MKDKARDFNKENNISRVQDLLNNFKIYKNSDLENKTRFNKENK